MQHDPILVRPKKLHLPGYIDAISRGWSSNTTRDVSGEELASINADAEAFLMSMDDPKALAGDIEFPDGTTVKRLPSLKRFIWDAGFCGIINLRWQNGTTDLPPHCLGHIGYSVVPWKQRRGYATRALAQLLPEARKIGLPYVELSTDADNLPSQKVITANEGVFLGDFFNPDAYANGAGRLYKIDL